jgi:hypothetical protein
MAVPEAAAGRNREMLHSGTTQIGPPTVFRHFSWSKSAKKAKIGENKSEIARNHRKYEPFSGQMSKMG